MYNWASVLSEETMPIYEYTCESCKQQVELLIRADDTPQCPECGSEKLEKQFSVPAAHSGSGGGLPVMPSGGG